MDPHVDFQQRAAVMKTVLHFLRRPFRNALKLALEEATWGNSRDDEVRQERGWKFLMLFAANVASPRAGRRTDFSCLVGGKVEAFAKGEWTKLLRASEICNEQAAIARQRQRRRRRG